MGKRTKARRLGQAVRNGTSQADDQSRIAVVNADKCKPSKCRQECKRFCPVVQLGKLCIEVTPASKVSFISESLCVGCGICVKRCPFNAVSIINLPKALDGETTHRYGPNGFKLHRLPMPRPGEVLGLVGTNGIGKSTALKVLANKIKPNLGDFRSPPEWEAIVRHFRGSSLQNYFTSLLRDDLKILYKPQVVDLIAKKLGHKKVGKMLRRVDKEGRLDQICKALDLGHLLDRTLGALSGGELQRFAIGYVAIQRADVYMFDEPSSYLDVRQRLRAAQLIRSLLKRNDAPPASHDAGSHSHDAAGAGGGTAASRTARSVVGAGTAPRTTGGAAGAGGAGAGAGSRRAAGSTTTTTQKGGRRPTYILAVEHDLAVLDFLSDKICCLYGTPGAYGVVTMPFSVGQGINIFLNGFVPTENVRFRKQALTFRASRTADAAEDEAGAAATDTGDARVRAKARHEAPESKEDRFRYPAMRKTMGGRRGRKAGAGSGGGDSFQLDIEAGSFDTSQIVVMLGENGTGKSTFIKLLAGKLAPDAPSGGSGAGPSTATPPLEGFTVSHKPQELGEELDVPGTVQDLLYARIRAAATHPQFRTDVLRPLGVEELADQEVRHLSGGQQQRLAIALALGTPAHVYLLDEPSAYLDSEQRIVAARVIRRFMRHAKKTAFVVEHDFIMATYLADRVVVYEGTPGRKTTARSPESLLSGMNKFLKHLQVTFRRDRTTYRPRINKLHSTKDQEQKKAGTYFFMED